MKLKQIPIEILNQFHEECKNKGFKVAFCIYELEHGSKATIDLALQTLKYYFLKRSKSDVIRDALILYGETNLIDIENL